MVTELTGLATQTMAAVDRTALALDHILQMDLEVVDPTVDLAVGHKALEGRSCLEDARTKRGTKEVELVTSALSLEDSHVVG